MFVIYLHPILFCLKYALKYDMFTVVAVAFKQPFPPIIRHMFIFFQKLQMYCIVFIHTFQHILTRPKP
jgi:hypothetical protein